ncbi:hypothetical protein FKP32DRAFT_1681656 [Trametes sanguinea]|nr:hypothetical protein FKP32DRAFT_1681656 [Trametes sanguinea]
MSDTPTPKLRTNKTLTTTQAALFQQVLGSCAACYAMCMTAMMPGHVHYQHTHRISLSLAVAFIRRRSPATYYAYISNADQMTMIAFVLDAGVWPVAAGQDWDMAESWRSTLVGNASGTS